MNNRFRQCVLVCVGMASAVIGCNKPQKMDPSAMRPPPRPVELDQLEPWVGSWSTSGDMTMPDGKSMKMSGNSTIAWECDRRVLMERAEGEMEGMPGKDISII